MGYFDGGLFFGREEDLVRNWGGDCGDGGMLLFLVVIIIFMILKYGIMVGLLIFKVGMK